MQRSDRFTHNRSSGNVVIWHRRLAVSHQVGKHRCGFWSQAHEQM